MATNPEQILKLTEEEQKVIAELSSLAQMSEGEVKRLLQSLFLIAFKNIREKNYQLIIPYIVNLKFDYDISEKQGVYYLQEKFNVEASEAFHEVLINAKNNSRSWLHAFYVHTLRRVLHKLFNTKEKNKRYKDTEEEKVMEEFVYADG